MKLLHWLCLACVGSLLVGCGGGGGGGGGGGSPIVRPDVPYWTPQRMGVHAPLAGSGHNAPVTDIFVKDLNGDTKDEVVIGGRHSQNHNNNPRANLLQIYGWNNNNTFGNETTTWFVAGENQVAGTEPSIKFGDFNGDGRMDMLVPHSTDSSVVGPTYVYTNQGNNRLVRQTINFPDLWSHDSVVKDFNNDGRADFMVADTQGRLSMAFGQADGTFQTYTSAAGVYASSGLTTGNYLKDGRHLIIKTDASTGTNNAGQDVGLYSWSVATGAVVMTQIAVLPASRYNLPKWNGIVAASGSHEIRALTMDFNNDGWEDVIVFSSPGAGVGKYSEVQFLKNMQAGVFSDVTDSVLVGYNTSTMASYQPIMIDFNNDGLMDILLPSADKNSNRILIQTKEGKFVDSFGSTFKQFIDQSTGLEASAFGDGWYSPINIINGPDNVKYLITTVNFGENGNVQQAVYMSRIGTTGTVTAQASIDTIQQIWPYLSSATANEVLAASSFRDFPGYDPAVHGNGIIDLSRITIPIGELGLSFDGRKGKTVPLTGVLAIPGIGANLKTISKSVAVVDRLKRDFRVNLTSMLQEVPTSLQPISTLAHDSTKSWSNKFTQLPEYQNQGYMSAYSYNEKGEMDNYSFGLDSSIFKRSTPSNYKLTLTQVPYSPWLAMSGVWGKVTASTIVELSATTKQNHFWGQIGAMHTTTAFEKGLVTSISPITSIYAVGGFEHKGWNLYGGIKPVIVDGYVKLNVPTSVDRFGDMKYTTVASRLRNKVSEFGGVKYTWSNRNSKFTADAVMDSNRQFMTSVAYKMDF